MQKTPGKRDIPNKVKERHAEPSIRALDIRTKQKTPVFPTPVPKTHCVCCKRALEAVHSPKDPHARHELSKRAIYTLHKYLKHTTYAANES